MCTKEPLFQYPAFLWVYYVMTTFTYDVIDPCDLIQIPAKYGLFRNSKNVPPPFTYPTYVSWTVLCSSLSMHLLQVSLVGGLENLVPVTSGGTPCFNVTDSWNGPTFWDCCNVLKLPPCANLMWSIFNSTKLPHPEV